jgi:putative ABC transport system permease protein
MTAVIDISPGALAAAYGLLIFPLGLILWKRLTIFRDAVVAMVRMTVQLLFVGFYLQFLFDLNSPGLNIAWLLVMVGVADVSILRTARLRVRRFLAPMFVSVLVATAIPLSVFLVVLLRLDNPLEASYMIPLAGMIMGNCLSANVIAMRDFYQTARRQESMFLIRLAQGANLKEAQRPFARQAIENALSPNIARTATIGLVSLPGMMTGVILGGNDPMAAIKYQIAIMVAIFAGLGISVYLGIRLTRAIAFDAWGTLDHSIFPAAPAGTSNGRRR